MLTSCPAICTKRDIDLKSGSAVVKAMVMKHRYHGNMGGDGGKRSILDTVAEETEQHIQSIESQRWIYPRRSVDRVVTNRDKKGDESKSTSHVQFRQGV